MYSKIKLLCNKIITANFLIYFLFLSALVNAGYPDEMDAWAKNAEVGIYEPKSENWYEIVEKANKEGEVVVYTSSGRIKKLEESFNKVYPKIKLTVYDLGSTKSVIKTKKSRLPGYSMPILSQLGIREK